jgi:hypothetical protein
MELSRRPFIVLATIAGSIVTLVALPSRADDVGSTVAALKDEKKECRYLLQLYGRYLRTR